MLSHLRTVAVLDRLQAATEALRDAVKDSFVRRKTTPHEVIMGTVEGVAQRLEDTTWAVRSLSGQGAGAGRAKGPRT